MQNEQETNKKELLGIIAKVFKLDNADEIEAVRNGKVSPIGAVPNYLDPDMYKKGKFKLLYFGTVNKVDVVTKQTIIDADGNTETVDAVLLLCIEKEGQPCQEIVRAMQEALVAHLKQYVQMGSYFQLEYLGTQKSSQNSNLKYQKWEIKPIQF